MSITQSRPRRKQTGARYKDYRKKRHSEKGSSPSFTKLGAKRVTLARKLGGERKLRMLSSDTANLYDPKSKKYKQVKIKTITDNPANRHFVRRNIMTKGAVIDTEAGKARVTSRPGQDGVVNAVLV